MPPGRIAILFVWLLLSGTCVESLPLNNAPCPCPAGYCCSANVCMPGASCPNEPLAQFGLSRKQVAGPDVLVAGLTASGNWLGYLSGITPASSPPGRWTGQLIVHDLVGLSSSATGVILSPEDPVFAQGCDGILFKGRVWTAATGQSQRDYWGVTGDGRFAVTLPTYMNELWLYDLRQTTSDTPMRIQPLRGNFSTVFSAFAPNGEYLLAFDYDGAGDQTGRLLRIPTDPSLPMRTFETTTGERLFSGVIFTSDQDAVFADNGNIFLWRPGDALPITIGTLSGTDTHPGLRASGGFLYVIDRDTTGPIRRIDLATFRSEPTNLYLGSFGQSSPDGRFVVGYETLPDRATSTSIVDLRSERVLATFDRSCVTGQYGVAIRGGYTSGIQYFIGALTPPCPLVPASAPTAGLISVDLRTGALRTLAQDSVATDAVTVGDKYALFVRLPAGVKNDWRDRSPPTGTLTLVDLETGAEHALETGADIYLAGRRDKVAYTLHGRGALDGLYVLEPTEPTLKP